MKTFPSYDYTLCDNEDCKKKESCMRYLTYRKSVDENYPYRIVTLFIVGVVQECNMYVKAE